MYGCIMKAKSSIFSISLAYVVMILLAFSARADDADLGPVHVTWGNIYSGTALDTYGISTRCKEAKPGYKYLIVKVRYRHLFHDKIVTSTATLIMNNTVGAPCWTPGGGAGKIIDVLDASGFYSNNSADVTR